MTKKHIEKYFNIHVLQNSNKDLFVKILFISVSELTEHGLYFQIT